MFQLPLLRRAVEPGNAEPRLLAGKALLALDRVEDAARALEEASRLDPACGEANSLLVWCYTSMA